MVKLQEVKGQYTITIPNDMILKCGWVKGERLFVSLDNRTGEIIISKLKEPQ